MHAGNAYRANGGHGYINKNTPKYTISGGAVLLQKDRLFQFYLSAADTVSAIVYGNGIIPFFIVTFLFPFYSYVFYRLVGDEGYLFKHTVIHL